jgi:hypothetical protein
MNPFSVILTPEAQCDILRLDAAVQTRILNRYASRITIHVE